MAKIEKDLRKYDKVQGYLLFEVSSRNEIVLRRNNNEVLDFSATHAQIYQVLTINPNGKRMICYKKDGYYYLLGNFAPLYGRSRALTVNMYGYGEGSASLTRSDQTTPETQIARVYTSYIGDTPGVNIQAIFVDDIELSGQTIPQVAEDITTMYDKMRIPNTFNGVDDELTLDPDTTAFVIPHSDTGTWSEGNQVSTSLTWGATRSDYDFANISEKINSTISADNGLINSSVGSGRLYSNNQTPPFNSIVSKPFNILITADLPAAKKYITDGTIPPDATVNDPRVTGDDSNEQGEDGYKRDTFDESEPTAPIVNSSKLSNLHHYWITENQMQSFYEQVWNTDLTDFVKGAFTGIYSNLISNVVSLKYMPTSSVNLGGTGDSSPLILGFKTYDELTVQTVGTSVAPIVDIGKYKFTKEYNSFADYAPYTDIRLYLPFVGVVPLDTNLFMGAGGDTPPTLHIRAQYDLQSGLITYFIMRNKTMISSASGRMAVEVPISLQSGLDTFTTISRNFTAKATSFVGNAMTGNPIGMVADIAQGSATAPPQTVFSSIGGDGAFYAHPKCMIMVRHPQYNRPKNYSHVVGFPAYVTKKVNDLNGFNIVRNPVIPLADGMTSVERDMIVSAMQNGLYY